MKRTAGNTATTVNKVKNTGSALTKQTYVELAKPSEYDPVKYYASVDKDMFHSIVMKYMQAHGSHGAMQHAMPEHSAHKGHSEDEE